MGTRCACLGRTVDDRRTSVATGRVYSSRPGRSTHQGSLFPIRDDPVSSLDGLLAGIVAAGEQVFDTRLFTEPDTPLNAQQLDSAFNPHRHFVDGDLLSVPVSALVVLALVGVDVAEEIVIRSR